MANGIDASGTKTRREINTLIYGSCVSRDTFEYLKDDFKLSRYIARQSFISAGNSRKSLVQKLKTIKSPFQKRMVEGDLTGNAFSLIRNSSSTADLVIIDLVDERGGVIDFGGGVYASRLAEFWSAGGRELSATETHIELGSERHFELWKKGARRLVAELIDAELLHRTIVLNVPWASLTETEEAFEVPGWMIAPTEANEIYAPYFGYLRSLGLTIVDVPEQLSRTTETHKWGISPFHYVESTYEFIAGEIRKFAATLDVPQVYDGLPRRNPVAWGKQNRINFPKDFESLDDVNGFHVVVHNGLPLDILIEDNGHNTTLVSLHAALGAAKIDPPVFTGRAVSENIGLNRIFISDSSLYSSADLSLGWYLGTRQVNLTKLLVDVITAVQNRLSASHLVFFGSSGGGFAALNISRELAGSLAIPVNPQTRILDYAKVHWRQMAESCFKVQGEESDEVFLGSHPRADQRTLYAEGFENSVIYLQNSQDAHVSSQMIPWFEAVSWQAGLLLEQWGKGHVPPTSDRLRSLLKELAPVEGDWAKLADIWGANTKPTRSWVKQLSGR